MQVLKDIRSEQSQSTRMSYLQHFQLHSWESLSLTMILGVQTPSSMMGTVSHGAQDHAKFRLWGVCPNYRLVPVGEVPAKVYEARCHQLCVERLSLRFWQEPITRWKVVLWVFRAVCRYLLFTRTASRSNAFPIAIEKIQCFLRILGVRNAQKKRSFYRRARLSGNS